MEESMEQQLKQKEDPDEKKTLPSEWSRAIMQARTNKELTQADLAMLIREKPSTVQKYESGEAIPEHHIIAKLEGVLGVKLPDEMKVIPCEWNRAIKQARTNKKLTLEDLAMLIREKKSTVRKYESHEVIPEQHIITKLERVLGLKLQEKKVSPSEWNRAIMQARTNNKLTQADLSKLIKEKPCTIRKYESGGAIPEPHIIAKLEKVLGVKLLDEKVLPGEWNKAIAQARTNNRLTIADLAMLIGEKPCTIRKYECGGAIPEQHIITKLERVLGVKLPGMKYALVH